MDDIKRQYKKTAAVALAFLVAACDTGMIVSGRIDYPKSTDVSPPLDDNIGGSEVVEPVIEREPTIYTVSPISAGVGSTLRITGINLSSVAAENFVTLNGVPAPILYNYVQTEWYCDDSDSCAGKCYDSCQFMVNTLLVTVPKNENCTGPVKVTVKGKTATFIDDFTYLKTAVTTTLAGSTKGNEDGTGKAAKFDSPYGITIDAQGNLYVADTGNACIRKVTPEGVVTTHASAAVIRERPELFVFVNIVIRDIKIDAEGNLYFLENSQYVGTRVTGIRKLTPDGVVHMFAGFQVGYRDDTGEAAFFNSPSGIAIDSAGNLYVADTGNHRIRKVTKAGVVTTLAGGTKGYANGIGVAAQFNSPRGITIDSSGNLYVVDSDNHRIRKVTQAGVVTTLAGGQGYADGIGEAARFNSPSGIAIDSAGNLYVTDNGNSRIRKVTPEGVVTTFATGIVANGIAIDAEDNLYVTNADHRILKITLE